MGGLLLLAFAYLAVGQAAANRNGAQTAADAAALAAAQEKRDQLADSWVDVVLDPAEWQAIFSGVAPVDDSCWRAYDLAARNDATAQCSPDGPLSFKVTVRSTRSVGDSIVPDTEYMYATASARAVIEPRCGFDPPGEEADEDVLPSLSCDDGRIWDLDPKDLRVLPEPEDLFDVHLAD